MNEPSLSSPGKLATLFALAGLLLGLLTLGAMLGAGLGARLGFSEVARQQIESICLAPDVLALGACRT